MKDNVEKSVKYLEKLKEKFGEEWKQKLDSYLKDEEVEMDNSSKACISDFLMTYKEEIMDNETAQLQAVEKKINNDLLFKNLKNYMENLLEPYYAFAPLRAFYVKNPDDTLKLMEDMFKQTILRFNHDILQHYSKYGFDNMDAFADFLNVLDSLCTYSVKKNLYCDAIEDLIYSQTRLQKVLCKRITDLIDSNFNTMKLNYIIEKLDELE
ncbi:MAG: hypothetical protein J6K43_03245 [Lachnospiraceae bacterium]|nr:hypothetical protein [Lachnospiraceae bacterium]